jgi:hypothetical protein
VALAYPAGDQLCVLSAVIDDQDFLHDSAYRAHFRDPSHSVGVRPRPPALVGVRPGPPASSSPPVGATPRRRLGRRRPRPLRGP